MTVILLIIIVIPDIYMGLMVNKLFYIHYISFALPITILLGNYCFHFIYENKTRETK